MTLIEFLETRTPEQRKAFLNKLIRDDGETYHPNAIRACATGRRRTGHRLAMLIEFHSNGRVRRWEMRPDIWQPKSNGKRKPPKRKTKARAAA
jgi:hypothetical protein